MPEEGSPRAMMKGSPATLALYVLHDDGTESLSGVFIIRQCRGRFSAKVPSNTTRDAEAMSFVSMSKRVRCDVESLMETTSSATQIFSNNEDAKKMTDGRIG